MATPHHKKPCPSGRKIYNFSRCFLGHYYYDLSLPGPVPELRRFLKKYINFTLFTPKLPLLGVKVMNFCLLTLQMLHTKFG